MLDYHDVRRPERSRRRNAIFRGFSTITRLLALARLKPPLFFPSFFVSAVRPDNQF